MMSSKAQIRFAQTYAAYLSQIENPEGKDL
jgi:hypothetical protein